MKKLFTATCLAILLVFGMGSYAMADTIANANAGPVSANAMIDVTGSEANAGAKANTEQTLTQTFEAAEMKRGFHVSPEYHNLPGLVTYSGPTRPNHRFRSASELILYKKTFTVGELIEMINPSVLKPYNEYIQKIAGMDKVDDTIKIFVGGINKSNGDLIRYPEPVSQLGYVGIAELPGDDASSVDCLGILALLAHAKGGNVLHIVVQGVERETSSRTIGIGMSWTGASMNTAGDESQVRGGGFGVAWAKGGYDDNPFLSGTVLLDEELAKKPESKEEK